MTIPQEPNVPAGQAWLSGVPGLGEPLAPTAWNLASRGRDSRSLAVAQSISSNVGRQLPSVMSYLDSLSKVPYEHMVLLREQGTRIVFAHTIVRGLAGTVATQRRGRQLDQGERWHLDNYRSRRSNTVAIYDPEVDVIVFPTTYAQDFDHVTHHEVGHALTMRRVRPRRALLRNLPSGMAEQTTRGLRADATPAEELRHSVFEALAESYVYLLANDKHLLPPALRDAVEQAVRPDASTQGFQLELGDAIA